MHFYAYLFRDKKYSGIRKAFIMTKGFSKVKFRVEVITLKAKAPTLKYMHLGFWLQLESAIIDEISIIATRVIACI